MPATGDKVSRLFTTAKRFRAWQTIEAVAAHTQVSTRTLRRDLESLSRLGFTVSRRLTRHTAQFKVTPPAKALY